MLIVIVCVPVCDVKNYAIYQVAFPRNQKCQDKNLNRLRTKRTFETKEVKPTILEGKSPILIHQDPNYFTG